MTVIRGVAALAVVLVGLSATASAGIPHRKPPRIVGAVMLDVDRDARADAVRLTYSGRIRHARDRDGRYPFAVAAYRIRAVGAASGKTLVLTLVERTDADGSARPAIRYRRTKAKPVAWMGVQAAAQLFRSVRPHGHVPPTIPPPVAPHAARRADARGRRRGRDARRAGLRATRRCDPAGGRRRPGPRLRRLELRRARRDGEGCDLRLANRQGRRSGHATEAEAADPGGSSGGSAGGRSATSLCHRGRRDVRSCRGASGIDIYGGYAQGTLGTEGRDSDDVIVGAPEAILAAGAHRGSYSS